MYSKRGCIQRCWQQHQVLRAFTVLDLSYHSKYKVLVQGIAWAGSQLGHHVLIFLNVWCLRFDESTAELSLNTVQVEISLLMTVQSTQGICGWSRWYTCRNLYRLGIKPILNWVRLISSLNFRKCMRNLPEIRCTGQFLHQCMNLRLQNFHEQ